MIVCDEKLDLASFLPSTQRFRGGHDPLSPCSDPSLTLRPLWRRWAGEPGAVNEFLNKLSPDTSLKISLLTCTTHFRLVNRTLFHPLWRLDVSAFRENNVQVQPCGALWVGPFDGCDNGAPARRLRPCRVHSPRVDEPSVLGQTLIRLTGALPYLVRLLCPEPGTVTTA